MTSRKISLSLVVAIVLITILFLLSKSFESTRITTESQIIINGKIITVEIADDPDERKRGLMFREFLPPDHGMIFVFDREDIYSFWMMNVEFSLDIIWISNDGTVVHIERSVPTCSWNCPSYAPTAPAKYVLEIESGFAEDINLRKGSFAEISLLE
ncbi:MAG: hypothetical protein CMO12_01570 [Thaumarchaeota archaeon]|nr:hypothetical protein [Nitrososphaerota archaeon]